MAFSFGYNMALTYNRDGLAATYTAIAVLWTAVLTVGIIFLMINRNLPYIRIRNIPLALSAVALLHVYWCLSITAYFLNGNFPCGVEFWIMSTYLPLGVALFQTSNSQLLYIAGAQKKFVYSEDGVNEKPESRTTSNSHKVSTWWKSLNSYQKTRNGIAIGMVAQLIVTLIIFLLSRMFHPSFGGVGHVEDKVTCRKGWQWTPSIIWQFTWAWIYAPYLLWKIRRIGDVHNWRLQTIICSLAGLPGTPMWLVALYAPAFHNTVNRRCPPPVWFTPGIAVMEASLVFMPFWQIVKNRRLKTETLDIIAEWEQKQRHSSSIESESTKVARHSTYSQKSLNKSTTSNRRGEMYTMQALEKALQANPTPLLLFAALKDFSGENIGFLKEVQVWKRDWTSSTGRQGFWHRSDASPETSESLRRRQFERGVQIYSSFVSLKSSSYPINLSSAHYKELEHVFDGGSLLASACSAESAVTPFDSNWSSKQTLTTYPVSAVGQTTAVSSTAVSTDDLIGAGQQVAMRPLQDPMPSWAQIPNEFDSTILNHSEESIKYMVLTNTWPKFVSAGFATSTEKKSSWTDHTAILAQFHDICAEQWRKMVQRKA